MVWLFNYCHKHVCMTSACCLAVHRPRSVNSSWVMTSGDLRHASLKTKQTASEIPTNWTHKTGTALDQDFKILANNFFSIQAFNWKRVQLWVFMWTHYILQPLPEAAGWAIFDICDWLAEQRQRGGLLCTVTAKEPVDFTGSPGVKGRVCRIQGDLGRDMKYEWRVSPERNKANSGSGRGLSGSSHPA